MRCSPRTTVVIDLRVPVDNQPTDDVTVGIGARVEEQV